MPHSSDAATLIAAVPAALAMELQLADATAATLLGGLPLALGTGPGAELRWPLGIAIVGGLIVSQFVTLFTTPVIYLYMDRLWSFFQSRTSDRPVVEFTESAPFSLPAKGT